MEDKIKILIRNGSLAGSKFSVLERMTCLIGREPECTIQFSDTEDGAISRHHCILDLTPPQATIRDLGSTNGTVVNGENIGLKPNETEHQLEDCVLLDGDIIKIGEVIIELEITKAEICCKECNAIIEESELEFCLIDGEYICDDCQGKLNTIVPKELGGADEELNIDVTLKLCEKCFKHPVKYTENNDRLCSLCMGDTSEFLTTMLSSVESEFKNVEDEFDAETSLDSYKIEKVLGQGGMGMVYLATHKQTEEKVAIKIMLPQVAMNKKAQQTFLREVNITKILEHDNIVSLKGSGFSNGSYFFTMDYCDAGSLDQLIKDEGKLDYKTALDITFQMLDGLYFAHNISITDTKITGLTNEPINGLVHRDIKPGNIFLKSGENNKIIAKLGDFGLAKAFDSAGLSGCTRTGAVAGTLYFIPRQQVIDFKYSTADVDLWAAMATFYYMITGKSPRDFKEGVDPLRLLLQSEPVPILQRGVDIPAKLANVIDSALDDSNKLKYKNAMLLKKDLEEAIIC